MLSAIIDFILMPIVWIPVVGILAFLTYRNYKKLREVKVLNVDSVLLMLEIPRANDKKELAAEQMFASLHGILRDAAELKNSGGVQEHLSFEIVSTKGQIRFYVWVPQVLQSFVEGQIYAQYPTVQIYKMNEDYVDHRDQYPVKYSSEIVLTENEALPIKTFDTFEVDPLAGITGTLAKLDDRAEMWIQILARPIPDDWHKETTDKWVKKIKSGQRPLLRLGNIDFTWMIEALGALFRPPEGGSGDNSAPELSERAKTQIAKAEEKATKLGYEVKIRLAYLGSDEITAKLNMQALVGTFKQYNSTNLNGFKMTGATFKPEALDAYKMREMRGHGFILNISELASVYHLPHTSVETPNIVWANSKTAEPPSNLPMLSGDSTADREISAFGLTNFRNINRQFGLWRRDRGRHVYIIGQTGAGKSGLLELLALSDVFHNQGYCIIDPHGDFAINNLHFVPAHRVNDVVYFNPSDTEHPVAFNPLEVSDPSRKPNICSEVIGVLKRMFGDSWGPRLEHILRNTLLALLDRPSTTLLDISRMLTDKEFRKETLSYCRDVTVLQFWKQEFGQWNEKQVNESIAPVLNKVGAFTANPIVRNIIGQTKSSFDIRQIMDEGKILVVNLSKGLIGEDNAGILGAFLVTKVQLAAMSRSDIPRVEDRRPFYLYVDEFQNFATDSFAVILSEARKYGLNLTVANQYIAQMTDTVRDAVFGNVGTTISFRVSPEDAPFLAKQFEPTFEAGDLVQLNNRNFVISMIINGEKVPAFSASTLSLPQTPQDNFAAIVQASRAQYSRPRATVEAEIKEAIEASEKYKKELSDSGREAGSRGGGSGAFGRNGSTSGAGVIASGAPKLTFKELGATSVSVSPAASDSPTGANASGSQPSTIAGNNQSNTSAGSSQSSTSAGSSQSSTSAGNNQSSVNASGNQSSTIAGDNQSGANASSSNEINLKKLERGKISPNTATGKQAAGLKDLGALVAEAEKEAANKATASDAVASAAVTPPANARPANASAEAGKSTNQNTEPQASNQAHQTPSQNASGRKKHKRGGRRRR